MAYFSSHFTHHVSHSLSLLFSHLWQSFCPVVLSPRVAGRNAWNSGCIRYPDPAIKVNDTVKIDLATGKITDFVKFDTGALAMVTGGRNMGRVGVITHRERHDGGFNIVHLKDAIDNSFATREANVFVIGTEKPWISLPKGRGVKLSIAEERDRRRAKGN
ncbi:uncharacterized protein SPSK_03667 [Sporothrix schenckii 1099-18]|uniref:40S ribosomal protein S4 n=1 Tax=Sporothrix schenckii 1099-18 TaxID=1397361 RepID=A0A0F2M205_SPOSC|nr:uncharacterized protein SPSK_03667 [Sporothrix schenckii 1099-18]KJR82790.1 hypothetical protein SPSK_03667 [Sporothrix schenckii 1099-18]